MKNWPVIINLIGAVILVPLAILDLVEWWRRSDERDLAFGLGLAFVAALNVFFYVKERKRPG